MSKRRGPLFLSGILSVCLMLPSVLVQAQDDALMTELQRIENVLDARIGFSAYDSETGVRWEYNADQRFAMSSTFKTLACAALLQRVDSNQEQLERTVSFSKSDLVTYSPITEQHADNREMSLFELCEATMTTSDNTAANLILQAMGGPGVVTEFAREIGDNVTRLDRWETELNQATPGDDRDTTTPNAMVANLKGLLLGDVLSPNSKSQLREWLVGNKVADGLFRASMPAEWIIADRTGAGGFGSRAITAVIWPPERLPIVVAFYITETTASFEDRNTAIAELGRVIKDVVEAK
ncbi:class A beta-lactamase [Nitrincola nitratireducens]|uniref:Beta-lactamase n=1 Tax=Nitrincola nitratireducens TaxID=1229521 RepID=W9UVN9_9GAMM|nr:class A beta-lactamase [Nitrincola nitratireducens]EXJ11293.1 Beta-lactamase precursor [Nitrincola nitratireducens]